MTAPVDPAWLAAEVAKAPAHLTAEQQRRLRQVFAPVPIPRPAFDAFVDSHLIGRRAS